VAELAAVARAAPGASGGREDETGDVPLAPMQQWFFELGLEDLDHFNQAVLLDLRQEVAAGGLARALGQVVDRHAALRLRFSPGGESRWRQVPSAPAGAG